MKADDKRHGSVAGYRAHRNSRTPICDPCREAKNAYNRARQTTPRVGRTTKAKTDYISGGFNPNDGLTGGRWMWDDRRAIRVWVRTEAAA